MSNTKLDKSNLQPPLTEHDSPEKESSRTVSKHIQIPHDRQTQALYNTNYWGSTSKLE